MSSSSDQNLCGGTTGTLASAWSGDDVQLLHNGNLIHTFQSGFTDEQKCLDQTQVDENHDLFELRSAGTDGVSDFKIFLRTLSRNFWTKDCLSFACVYGRIYVPYIYFRFA